MRPSSLLGCGDLPGRGILFLLENIWLGWELLSFEGRSDLWGPHQSCSLHFSQSSKGFTEGGFPGSPWKNAAKVCLSLSAQQPVALPQWVAGHGLHCHIFSAHSWEEWPQGWHWVTLLLGGS